MKDPVISPCKDCEDRSEECHATCKAFAAWEKRHKAWLEKVRAEEYTELYEYIGDRHYWGRER